MFVASASAQVTRNTAPVPPPAPNPANSADQGNIDLAYGAFQRGHYLTAFNEASKRAQQNDPAAMTLLGEIYAQGLGVGRDDSKAAQWYKMAAAKGDRDALFALAMLGQIEVSKRVRLLRHWSHWLRRRGRARASERRRHSDYRPLHRGFRRGSGGRAGFIAGIGRDPPGRSKPDSGWSREDWVAAGRPENWSRISGIAS